MSRARHRAKGGSVKETVYAGEGSNALASAKERKKGGAVHGEGDEPKMRGDRAKRARGGGVPGRARGGGIGSDSKPLTSAAKIKLITPGEQPEDSAKSD